MKKKAKSQQEIITAQVNKYSLEKCRKEIEEALSELFRYWFSTFLLSDPHEYKTQLPSDVIDAEDSAYINNIMNMSVTRVNATVTNIFNDLYIMFPIKYRPAIDIDIKDPDDLSNKDSLRITVTDWNYPCFTEQDTRIILITFLLMLDTLLKSN